MTCMLDEDEADIEADIQRELDALGNDLLQIEDLEEDSLTAVHVKENEVPTDVSYIICKRRTWKVL